MGYFGIYSSRKLSKIANIELQILFYSFFGFVVFGITRFSGLRIGYKEIIYTFFPTIFERYWFMTAYMIIYILSPFINKAAVETSHKSFRSLLIICFTLWSVIPFFTRRVGEGMFWTQLLWFFVMYLYGAYVRRFTVTVRNAKPILALITCGYIVVTAVSSISKRQIVLMIPGYLSWSNGIYAVIFILCLFSIAVENETFYSKRINTIAGYMLGVYLFHESYFVQGFLWQRIFNTTEYWGTIKAVWISLLGVAFVLVAGSAIEMLRKKLEKGIIHNKLASVIERAIESGYSTITSLCKMVFSTTE